MLDKRIDLFEYYWRRCARIRENLLLFFEPLTSTTFLLRTGSSSSFNRFTVPSDGGTLFDDTWLSLLLPIRISFCVLSSFFTVGTRFVFVRLPSPWFQFRSFLYFTSSTTWEQTILQFLPYSGRILNKFLSAQLLGIKRERGTRKEEKLLCIFFIYLFPPPDFVSLEIFLSILSRLF